MTFTLVSIGFVSEYTVDVKSIWLDLDGMTYFLNLLVLFGVKLLSVLLCNYVLRCKNSS